jgi:hypothetical protein
LLFCARTSADEALDAALARGGGEVLEQHRAQPRPWWASSTRKAISASSVSG